LVFEWLDLSDQPCLEQLAIGLNAPAAFVGGLFASSISWAAKEQLSGAKQELLSHGFAAIVIPFLWLSVGKAIERRREDAPQRSSSWLRVSAIIALVFLCLVAVLVIVSFFLPGGQPLYLLKILIFAWIVAGVQILVRPGLNCALDNERRRGRTLRGSEQ